MVCHCSLGSSKHKLAVTSSQMFNQEVTSHQSNPVGVGIHNASTRHTLPANSSCFLQPVMTPNRQSYLHPNPFPNPAANQERMPSNPMQQANKFYYPPVPPPMVYPGMPYFQPPAPVMPPSSIPRYFPVVPLAENAMFDPSALARITYQQYIMSHNQQQPGETGSIPPSILMPKHFTATPPPAFCPPHMHHQQMPAPLHGNPQMNVFSSPTQQQMPGDAVQHQQQQIATSEHAIPQQQHYSQKKNSQFILQQHQTTPIQSNFLKTTVSEVNQSNITKPSQIQHLNRTYKIVNNSTKIDSDTPMVTHKATYFKHRIFVGSLARNTTPDDMARFFSEHGVVIEAKVILDDAGISRGYGFVSFTSEEPVKTILSQLPIYMNSKRLAVASAIRKHQEDD